MKYRPVGFVCGSLAVLSIWLYGCNANDARNLTQDTRNLAQHTGQSLGNAELAARVNTILASWKGIAMSGLHIESEGGTVTISGHVRNEEERRRIIREVLPHIRGVDHVVSKDLHVQP